MACCVAGRKLVAESHAPAPVPVGAEAPANLLFTVSAPRAVLTAGMLELEGVAMEVLFRTDRGDTGVFATGLVHSSCPCAYRISIVFGPSRPLYALCQPCFGDHRTAVYYSSIPLAHVHLAPWGLTPIRAAPQRPLPTAARAASL